VSIFSRRGKQPEMAISERELSQMTRELHDLHESTFPQVRKTLDELAVNLGNVVRQPSSRRGFVLGAAGALALGAATACSGGSSGPSHSATPSHPPRPAPPTQTYTGDLKQVALATALENLAITSYDSALKKAGAGQLGPVPAAVSTFVQTAMKQHTDHAQAWNAVLSKAGKPTITNTPLSNAPTQLTMLNTAKSVPDVATLALNLETTAAQTYTLATANITDPSALMTAATIQPVETMHAAILNFILGQYPAPDSFIATNAAITPDALTVH
jgi:hypothetical protein